jgi:D-2-hydroxyacid dehydrogenase (NADP+)
MKLLILQNTYSTDFRPLTDEHLNYLKESVDGLEVNASEDSSAINTLLPDVDAIAGYPWQIAQVDLQKAKNLRWVHSFSSGVDRILSPEIKGSDIQMSNSAGIHATPIAEHVVGFMLVWTRKFQEAFRAQIAHDWRKISATELSGKNVLVVGLGAIGTEVARLAKSFNTSNTGVVRSLRESVPPCVDHLITEDHLDDALPHADFICICLPYSELTHHRFGAKQFRAMKNSAVITNIGRGAIIDQTALIDALNEGAIAGAMLDVTEPEPLPTDNPLWDMPNVFITSHYAGLSEKYMDRAIERLILNLKAFELGRPLPNLVNKKLGY